MDFRGVIFVRDPLDFVNCRLFDPLFQNKFGYCRRFLPAAKNTPPEKRFPVVYCMVTKLRSFETFSKIFDQVPAPPRLYHSPVHTRLLCFSVYKFSSLELTPTGSCSSNMQSFEKNVSVNMFHNLVFNFNISTHLVAQCQAIICSVPATRYRRHVYGYEKPLIFN